MLFLDKAIAEKLLIYVKLLYCIWLGAFAAFEVTSSLQWEANACFTYVLLLMGKAFRFKLSSAGFDFKDIMVNEVACKKKSCLSESSFCIQCGLALSASTS